MPYALLLAFALTLSPLSVSAFSAIEPLPVEVRPVTERGQPGKDWAVLPRSYVKDSYTQDIIPVSNDIGYRVDAAKNYADWVQFTRNWKPGDAYPRVATSYQLMAMSRREIPDLQTGYIHAVPVTARGLDAIAETKIARPSFSQPIASRTNDEGGRLGTTSFSPEYARTENNISVNRSSSRATQESTAPVYTSDEVSLWEQPFMGSQRVYYRGGRPLTATVDPSQSYQFYWSIPIITENAPEYGPMHDCMPYGTCAYRRNYAPVYPAYQ